MSTAEPSQSASTISLEDAASADSSESEETGSKEIAIATASETCPFPECEAKCGRFQEQERHICERHLPPHVYCEQPGCDWTGNRRYVLQSHLKRNHPGISMSKLEAFMIYDAKSLAKQLRNKEISVEEAVHEACQSFEEKAEQMGKVGIWRWVTGL